jgi:ribosome modulation factor
MATKRKTPLDGAYLKGINARLLGDGRDACPYQDKRKWNGKLTWSRAFQNAWYEGWRFADKNREQAMLFLDTRTVLVHS